jgi:hypothetical protein
LGLATLWQTQTLDFVTARGAADCMNILRGSTTPYFDSLSFNTIRSSLRFPLPDGEENVARLKAQGIRWQGRTSKASSFSVGCIENTPSPWWNFLRPRLYARVEQTGQGCRVIGMIRVRWYPRVMLTVVPVIFVALAVSALLLKVYAASVVLVIVVIVMLLLIRYFSRDAREDWTALEHGIREQLSM